MEPYLGEIRMFAGTFAPRGWALCDGALLPIRENDALYAIVGTQYGGDGLVTFALPDLRGRAPISFSAAEPQSTAGGAETVSLAAEHLPVHNHGVRVSGRPATQADPAMGAPATAQVPTYGDGPPVAMANTSPTGGGRAHENMGPSLVVTFIICTEGLFPQRG